MTGEFGRGGLRVLLRGHCLGPIRLVQLDFLLARLPGDLIDWPRLLRGARTLGHLQYPDIVPVYEVGEHAGQPYFTVWLVEGPIARPWTESSSQEVALALARLGKAVHDAHQHAAFRKHLHPARIALDADLHLDRVVREQAGRDVFGLILCECLGDRPPSWAASPDPLPPLHREVLALKCPDRAPGRQYASAAELADEVERFLRGEVVQVRPVAP
jgi:serine/threonine-protein kinase